MWGTRYLAAYAVGMVVGVINEHVQKPHQPCYQSPDYSHVLTCGTANVYGWSVVALTAFFDAVGKWAPRVPTALTLLAVPVILAALEAVMGEISERYFGERHWNYPQQWCPAFGGSISIVSSSYFGIGGLLYWLFGYNGLGISRL